MIVEAIIKLLTSLVVGVLSLLPSAPPPAWFLDAGDQFGALMAQVGMLDHWVPVSVGVDVVTAVLACVGIGFTIKAVRLVLSYFTAGGGSAG